MEQDLVRRAGVDFVSIPAGAMHAVGVWRMVTGACKLMRGVVRACILISRFHPHVVLLTGGYVGVPVSIAAWLHRVPTVVYLPDIEPGQALKVMAILATKVATTTEESSRYIKAAKLVVTGYPVRQAFHQVKRDEARAHFGIGPNDWILLIFGGSKGARSINRAVTSNIQALLELQKQGEASRHAVSRVIHVSGQDDWPEVQAAWKLLPVEQRSRYTVFPYLHEEMASAMAAADLVVCRAGASVLGELPAVGLPAVLVPYPYAWRYQKMNASYLVGRGAAVMVEDAQLKDELVRVVSQLWSDPQSLSVMRQSMQAQSGRDGATEIAQLLLRVGVGAMG